MFRRNYPYCDNSYYDYQLHSYQDHLYQGHFCSEYQNIPYQYHLGFDARKTCLRVFANNKGADQGSLISTFVIGLLKSTISKLATNELSIFQLVSVAELSGLNLTLQKTSKTGFVATRPILISISSAILIIFGSSLSSSYSLAPS